MGRPSSPSSSTQSRPSYNSRPSSPSSSTQSRPSGSGYNSRPSSPSSSTQSRPSGSGYNSRPNSSAPSGVTRSYDRPNSNNNRPSYTGSPNGGNHGGGGNGGNRGGYKPGDNPGGPTGGNPGGNGQNRPRNNNITAPSGARQAIDNNRVNNNTRPGDNYNNNRPKPGGNHGGQPGGNKPGGQPGGNKPGGQPGGNHGGQPGGGNHGYRPGGQPGGGNHGYRPGGQPGGHGGSAQRPPAHRPHAGINHGGPRPNYDHYRWHDSFRPRGPRDRWYDYYRYNRWSWHAPIAPPHRPWRPRIVWYYRPIIPTGYRIYASAPLITGILGLEFGTLLDASLNYLYYNGYTIDGYQNNVVYLRDVNMMGYSWPDVMLQYDDRGGLCYAEFATSTTYSDNYRFNSLYNSLCSTYGAPINSGNGYFSWYGGNQTGFINLNFAYEDGRYYTVMTLGA